MNRRQRIFAAVVIALLLLSGVTTLWMATCGLAGCPSDEQLRSFRPSEGSRVLDRSGASLGRLSYVRRINAPLSKVPRHVRAAFIAAEDRRFFYHGGVDWRSAGRALARNLAALEVREGFSTITMQVVRSAFLAQLGPGRTMSRKLIEIELARRLERALTKQEILELYLNLIYLGNGTWGVEAASRDLFGKSVSKLSVGEAALLAGLARNVATHVAATTLAADAGGPDGPLDDDTVREYLDVLERLMVVENQPAWSPHLRSRRRLRQAPKRHFVDPSLAVAALRATPERLLADLNLLGFLFESLVIRDLRVYAQAADADVLQYRDSKGLEVDAIVEGLDGRWAAFEVKLDQARVDEAAESLLRFAGQVDTKRCGEPAALGVIVPYGYGFTLESGVQVIPIDALGP